MCSCVLQSSKEYGRKFLKMVHILKLNQQLRRSILKKEKNNKIIRKKEYGLHIIEGSLYAMASMEGKIKEEEIINDRVVLIKDKLKREVEIGRISIQNITSVEQIKNYPLYEKMIIYLNPYYELEVIKNLEPFPIDIENPKGMEWLNNFESYLAMNMLFYKEFKRPYRSDDVLNYTNREIIEAKEVVIDYYDLENPKTSPLERDQNLLYYHPKPGLLKQAEEDVLSYELALLAKALTKNEEVDIAAETGFNEEKIQKLLKILVHRSHEGLSKKAKAALKK